MKVNIKKLEKFDEEIQKIAKEFNLKFFPQEFDIIPTQKMLEIMAYGFPTNFPHWSHGRNYERIRTMYEHRVSNLPYEVVYYSKPCRAYLMISDPFVVMVLTMAHVYAHNDFYKNNVIYKPFRKDAIPAANLAEKKIRDYIGKYGLDEVEEIITAGLAIQGNIDPDTTLDKVSHKEKIKEMLDEICKKEKKNREERKRIKEILEVRTPLNPEKDILLYIIREAPKLKDWQRDILTIIRQQGLQGYPGRKCQIMNEGWAVFWHMRIMKKLYDKKMLTKKDWETYSIKNSGVLAHSLFQLNPYVLGKRIWDDVEAKYGEKELFRVRRSYSDRFFIERFLTKEIIDELQYYIYKEVPRGDHIDLVIVEKNWKKIRDILIHNLAESGPYIDVVNGNYKNKEMLYLVHNHDGIDLNPEYRKKTMEHLYCLWKKPVFLKTKKIVERGKIQTVVYTFNGKQHKEKKADNKQLVMFA